ncbi:cytochrome b [Polycladidibacter hongkongensis]|uniref:cytochrome b n=1 Tax=Polycladidibacter hongkongensis TaxID=1647556 RepID=UPI0008351D0D|nr:cytochrome b/b6 domain-containing protein [Pseudovibrio hongkongensis]
MPKIRPANYSSLQKALHWIIALLIFYQITFVEYLEKMGEAFRSGGMPDTLTSILGNGHIVSGCTILALVLLRLWLRIKNGAPAEPEGTSPLMAKAATAAHHTFYLILLLAPLSGIAMYFLGFRQAGAIHHFMEPAFLLLITLHVGAALWHQFIIKDKLLQRMI